MYLENTELPVVAAFYESDYRIQDIQLFRDIDDSHHQLITNHIKDCPVVAAERGQIVLNANFPVARLYIVLKGSLAISKPQENHLAAEPMNQFLPGECVGELSVLDQDLQPSTIIALCDSELLLIEADLLWQLVNQSNGVARNLLQLLSFRIRAANAQIRNRQKVGEFYRQMSMVDGLTGLHNRAWLNSNLPALVAQAHTNDTPLSIIMVDLDHFKRFNDEHGHLVGDDALQAAAKVLNAGLRPSDFAARYGGEEMMVILPATSHDAALVVAQRLCQRLAQASVFVNQNKPLPHITGSFGVATLAEFQDSQTLIEVADAALYRAKEAGRNQVAA